MKLNIEGDEIILDFRYTPSTRPLRKGEIVKTPKLTPTSKCFIPTVITTCTITLDNGCIVADSVKCDAKNHNRYFARKYSLEKLLKNYDKGFRTKIWEQYWNYIKSEKLEYLGINGFGFQNINGLITIDCGNKEIELTVEQKDSLIKLLK